MGTRQLVEAGCGESFTASTKVLLASGTSIPISWIKAGDKVLATNVKTGKTQAETVTAVMLKRDVDRYDLTIRAGHRTAVIDTTRNHLFWDLDAGRWVKARALKHGDHLRTPAGVAAAVTGGRTPADATGWMCDISVPGGGDHDFYIDVVHTAVLVHNCPMQRPPLPKWKQCVLSVMSALHIAHSAVTGEMVLGSPPESSYEFEYRAPDNPAGASPTPGNGGGEGGGGC